MEKRRQSITLQRINTLSKKELFDSEIKKALNSKYKTSYEKEMLSQFFNELPSFRNYFKQFDKEKQKNMIGIMRLIQVQQTTILFQKGDVSDAFYIVISGTIDLYDTKKKGELKLQNVCRQGESLGERGILMKMPRSLTAICRDNCELIKVKEKDFQIVLAPEFQKQHETKMEFLSQQLPFIKDMSKPQKERYSYYFELTKLPICTYLAYQGLINDCVY